MNKIYNVTSYVIAILMFPLLMLGDKPLLFLAPIVMDQKVLYKLLE